MCGKICVMNESKKTILKIILSIIVIGLIILVGYLVLDYFGLLSLTREQIQAYIRKTGALAPLAFIFITFLQVTFIPIPSTVTILAGNFLFGFWLSYLYSFIGLILGSVVAFLLGRVIGKPFVQWVAGGKDKLDNWVKRLKGRENVFLFFAFLFPFFPDDFLCTLAGILPVKFSVFMIMQIFTRITSIGGNLLFLSGEVIAYEGVGLVVIIALIILGIASFVLSMIYADKLNALFDKFVNKFKKKNR